MSTPDPTLFDDDGFLVDPGQWSEPLAEQTALCDGICPLDDLQMTLLRILRREYARHHSVTALSHVCFLAGEPLGCMQHLFPGAREARRLASLPNRGEEAKTYL